MNTAFEDVEEFVKTLIEFDYDFSSAAKHYAVTREKNTKIIQELSLKNGTEMFYKTADPKFLKLKALGMRLQKLFPEENVCAELHYNVSFVNISLAEALKLNYQFERIVASLALIPNVDEYSDVKFKQLAQGFIERYRYRFDAEFARWYDETSRLKEYRQQFIFPKKKVYLCGNSLGLMHKDVRAEVNRQLDRWAELGVEGHFGGEGWLPIHKRFMPLMAKIVGAQPQEVVVTDTLTNNLHKLLSTFYRPTRERNKVLMLGYGFSSDRYAVQSQIEIHGYSVESSLLTILPRSNEDTIREEDIINLIEKQGKEISVILLETPHFRTGKTLDIEKITQAAHEKGCKVCVDLAHATGNIPLKLHEWNVDGAAGCSYKYLNAGPGGLGFIFIHEKYHPKNHQQNSEKVDYLKGWWGNRVDTRFGMDKQIDPFHTV